MPKVSIIVPVYNVERYLRKCLDSLVNQSLKDIEIIIINDASPDKSREIMEEYDDKYDMVKTIYLEKNRCLGGARNAGVDVATGEYITFVDSDDYLDLDFCEKLYNEIKRTNSDFAYSAYITVNEKYENISEKIAYPMDFTGDITRGKKCGFINKGVFAWGKMFSLELWKKIGLKFPEHLKYEDAPTIPIYILHCKKCCCVSDTYYRYLIRETSILRTRNVGHDDAQETSILFMERMKKYGFYDDFLQEIEHFMVQRYYCVFLRRCVQMYDIVPYDKMKEGRDTIRQWFPRFEENPYHYVFVAEDRLRMAMNEISPQTCYIWEKEFKDSMLENKQIFLSMMEPFYITHMDKISDILRGKNKIALWGDNKKQEAFEIFLNKYFTGIVIERLNSKKVKDNFNAVEYDAIISVNPNASFGLQKIIKDVKVINLEDILNGYIGG